MVLGYKSEELIGRSMYDFIHPDDYAMLQQIHLQVLGGMHQSVAVTIRFMRKDGVYVWLESNVRIIFNALGEVLEAVSVSRDITQRRYLEQELEEMGQLMLGIHEKLSVFSFRVGADGNVLRSYGKGLKKLGPSEPQILQKNVFESFPQLKEYLQPGTRKDFFTVETNGESEGKPWWFQHFYFRDVNHDNELIGFAFDITDLKVAESKLIETKEMYRFLVNNFPDVAVFVFDEDLRFQFAEGQSLTAANWKTEDIVGKTLGDIFGNETSHPYYQPYKDAFKGHSKVFEIVIEGHTYVISVIPVRNAEGQIVSGMSISQDVTEKKLIEQAILKVAITDNDLERKELSEKLHDGLGQKIASVSYKLEQIDKGLLAADPLQLELLEMSKKSINLILTNLRELSNLIMPTILTDFGLHAAIEELCGVANAKGGIKIDFETPVPIKRKTLNIEMGVYRIIQDLLSSFETMTPFMHLTMQMYEKGNKLIVRAEPINAVDKKHIDNFENTREFFNITSRIKALNGHLVVKNLTNNPFLIILEIPLVT